MLSLTAKGEHCLHLFTFLLKQKNFYFEFIKKYLGFIMYFNENSTKKFMCNAQYRSSYYNDIAFLLKSTMCCTE